MRQRRPINSQRHNFKLLLLITIISLPVTGCLTATSHEADKVRLPLNEPYRLQYHFLHLFVDRSSVELFGNNGLIVFTERIFPTAGNPTVELFVDGGEVTLNSLEIYELEAAAFYETAAPE